MLVAVYKYIFWFLSFFFFYNALNFENAVSLNGEKMKKKKCTHARFEIIKTSVRQRMHKCFSIQI